MPKNEEGGSKADERVLSGIGSYDEPESARDAVAALSEVLSYRLDELLGMVEWLKTDRLRKGSNKNAEGLGGLSDNLEKLSLKMESGVQEGLHPWSNNDMEEGLGRLYEMDRGIKGLVEALEGAVRDLTAEKAVPREGDISGIRKILDALDHEVEARDALLRELEA